jgi:hypothetical protein
MIFASAIIRRSSLAGIWKWTREKRKQGRRVRKHVLSRLRWGESQNLLRKVQATMATRTEKMMRTGKAAVVTTTTTATVANPILFCVSRGDLRRRTEKGTVNEENEENEDNKKNEKNRIEQRSAWQRSLTEQLDRDEQRHK